MRPDAIALIRRRCAANDGATYNVKSAGRACAGVRVGGTIHNGRSGGGGEASFAVIGRNATGVGVASTNRRNSVAVVMSHTSLNEPTFTRLKSSTAASRHGQMLEHPAFRSENRVDAIKKPVHQPVLDDAAVGGGIDEDSLSARAGTARNLKTVKIDRDARNGYMNPVRLRHAQVCTEVIAARRADDVMVVRIGRQRIDRALDIGARLDLIERFHRRRGRAGRGEGALGKGGRLKAEG